MPGTLSLSVVAPAPQAVSQATAVADSDFPDHDEGETEDEADEDMDEFDDVDDAFDEEALAEEALAEEEAAQLAAFALVSSANEPIPQAYPADADSYLSEVEHILSDDSFISDAGDSDTPDLEEMASAPQTDQQMLEGKA